MGKSPPGSGLLHFEAQIDGPGGRPYHPAAHLRGSYNVRGRKSANRRRAWRSLVAHLLWEQRVGGSNPSAPTNLRALDSGGIEEDRSKTGGFD